VLQSWQGRSWQVCRRKGEKKPESKNPHAKAAKVAKVRSEGDAWEANFVRFFRGKKSSQTPIGDESV